MTISIFGSRFSFCRVLDISPLKPLRENWWPTFPPTVLLSCSSPRLPSSCFLYRPTYSSSSGVLWIILREKGYRFALPVALQIEYRVRGEGEEGGGNKIKAICMQEKESSVAEEERMEMAVSSLLRMTYLPEGQKAAKLGEKENIAYKNRHSKVRLFNSKFLVNSIRKYLCTTAAQHKKNSIIILPLDNNSLNFFFSNTSKNVQLCIYNIIMDDATTRKWKTSDASCTVKFQVCHASKKVILLWNYSRSVTSS